MFRRGVSLLTIAGYLLAVVSTALHTHSHAHASDERQPASTCGCSHHHHDADGEPAELHGECAQCRFAGLAATCGPDVNVEGFVEPVPSFVEQESSLIAARLLRTWQGRAPPAAC